MSKKKIMLALLLAGLMGTAEARDLSLVDAVNLAIERNPTVRITELGEMKARATLTQSRAANSFKVTLGTNFSLNQQNKEDHTTGNGTTLAASLPIYNGGKTVANIKSAELGVDAARLTTLREYEAMQNDVIQSYYTVLYNQRNLEIKKEAESQYQDHLTNTTQLYEAGSKARVDVLRSSVQYTDAVQARIVAQTNLANSLYSLKNLLYIDQTEDLTLTDDVVVVDFPDTADYCVSYGLDKRKDLLVSKYAVEQNKLNLKAAKAGWLPTVDLNLSAGWNKQVYPHDDNHNYTASIGVNFNAFDSGATKGQVLAAEANLLEAENQLLANLNNAELDIRQSYNSMQEAKNRFTSTENAVNEAKESLYVAQEKYRAGEGILLDVIDAQAALSQAELNFINAKYDYAKYKATLEYNMGLDYAGDVASRDVSNAKG